LDVFDEQLNKIHVEVIEFPPGGYSAFVRTMFSPDSMLLKYAGHFYGNPVTNYLFTKQN